MTMARSSRCNCWHAATRFDRLPRCASFGQTARYRIIGGRRSRSAHRPWRTPLPRRGEAQGADHLARAHRFGVDRARTGTGEVGEALQEEIDDTVDAVPHREGRLPPRELLSGRDAGRTQPQARDIPKERNLLDVDPQERAPGAAGAATLWEQTCLSASTSTWASAPRGTNR